MEGQESGEGGVGGRCEEELGDMCRFSLCFQLHTQVCCQGRDHFSGSISPVWEETLLGFAPPCSVYLGWPKWFWVQHCGGVGFAELLCSHPGQLFGVGGSVLKADMPCVRTAQPNTSVATKPSR